MATAESDTTTDGDVQTTDGVPTDALQLVIERAEIEVDELAEYGDEPEEVVTEIQEAIETVKEAVENDDNSGDQADETPELTVGEPCDGAGLTLIFRVHGVDLTDERFAGMFDVGAECAGIEYPRDGGEHMAHDASNIVYHGLKERFGWADEQVSGVAPGVERFEE